MNNFKVKFKAESGEELRRQMLDFLGINGSVTVKAPDLMAIAARQVANSPELKEDPLPENEAEKAPATETATKTRTRRSKAEIEADKLTAEQSGDTIPSPEIEAEANKAATQQEQPLEQTPATNDITRPVLTELVLTKGREGKKPALLAAFAGYQDAAGIPVTGLPTLKPEDYAAFYAEIKDL